MTPERYAMYFGKGSFQGPDFRADFRTEPIATLRLPTGQIVACDVVEGSGTSPYSRPVAPGDYAVALSIARIDDDDERVAASLLRLSTGEPVRFELATMKDTGDHTFTIDSSLGCYLDEAALALLDAMTDAEDELLVEELDRQYAKHQVDTWSWASLDVGKESGVNLVCFSSGWGDDDYFSYFGFDAQGAACCLVTDFRLLDEDEE